jgi:DMSO/TMAO reductase YedYZ molybdopterin-dependent catalytic subunit
VSTTTGSTRVASSPATGAAWRDGPAAIAGVVATLAALGVSELLAGLLPGATSLLAAVAQVIVDNQPPGAKDVFVGLFGTNDKLALEVIIALVAMLIGAGLGLVARRRYEIAAGAFIAFGVVGFFASLRDPLANPAVAAAATAIAVGAGLWVLGWLLDLSRPVVAGHAASAPAPASSTRVTPLGASETASGSGRPTPVSPSAVRKSMGRPIAEMPDWSRRAFMIRAGAVGVGAVALGVVGRNLLERQRIPPAGDGPAVPPASVTVPGLTPDEDLSTTIAGLTPIVMPNDAFYRIDTSFLTPSLSTTDWTLRIYGMVDRETTLTWAQLVALPMFEQYVTIACVSNEVGDKLVGNAKWTGVRLRDVLDIAGVQAGATQLVGRTSVSDFTAGMPMAWVMDPAREPMIALKMNDEPLPPNHGYPARLIVPGLYGYVSATKWLTELEVTTFEAVDGYWVPLGWAKEAPILTQSRIDTPRGDVTAGQVPIAGIAWAPDRGISRVEVAIDGVWGDARMSHPISDATWVQWVVDWAATPGRHVIMVRATDGTGAVQEQIPSPPAPDGARGWHTISVQVG